MPDRRQNDGGGSVLAAPKTAALAQWFGTNRTCARAAGEELAGCEWVGVTFAGGMTEIPYIGARSLLVNDAHKAVVNLARVTADARLQPVLYRRLRRMAFHPDELAAAQERCRLRESAQDKGLFQTADEIGLSDRLEWALDFFVTTWMARAGDAGTDGEYRGGLSVRYDAGGGGSAVRFRSATRSLIDWRRALERAEFSTLDAFDFLAKCADKPGHGIYNDPPFPGPGDAYRHKFSIADHRRLARELGRYKVARVVCRFYEHPLIRELYPEPQWTWRALVGRTQTNAKAAEVLLLNGPSRATPSHPSTGPASAKLLALLPGAGGARE